MTDTDSACVGCALPRVYCCCDEVTTTTAPVRFVLLLHENEPGRLSNTSRLIKRLLPNTEVFIWQRKEPPAALLEMLKNDQFQPWLLFPADRPELQPRARAFAQDDDKTPLIIVPDGTWKEVRKIVRKSPWLEGLPLLALNPSTTTRYKLRRNPDEDHLCTAETVAEILRLAQAPVQAEELDNLLDRFLSHYHAWQHHLPPPDKG